MRQRTSVASQPSFQRSQVLFRRVVFGKTGPNPTGCVIDQRDQLTPGAALLQPTERGALLHPQPPETAPALPAFVDFFPPLGGGTPEGLLGHPLPHRLPAH